MNALVVVALGAAIALLRGGRIKALPSFPWAPVLFAALALQALAQWLPSLTPYFIMFGNALTVAFLSRNWKYLELRVVLIGASMNTLVIWANGGWMPVWQPAAEMMGLPLDVLRHGYIWHSALTAHTLFPVLADLIYSPVPIPNVMSIGDLFIYAGIVLLIQRLLDRPVDLVGLTRQVIQGR